MKNLILSIIAISFFSSISLAERRGCQTYLSNKKMSTVIELFGYEHPNLKNLTSLKDRGIIIKKITYPWAKALQEILPEIARNYATPAIGMTVDSVYMAQNKYSLKAMGFVVYLQMRVTRGPVKYQDIAVYFDREWNFLTDKRSEFYR